MSGLRRPAIVSGVVGLLATVVVLAGAGAQEAPQVEQPKPCDTVNETLSTAPPTTVPPTVPVTAPTTTTPSTLPSVPVETPTPLQPPEEVPSPPCPTSTTTTLPPLPPDDDEYFEDFFGGPIYTGVFGDTPPFEEPYTTDTTIGETAAAPMGSADTTDAQPIAMGEGGFRYAQVFVLPLLMLLLAAAVAWTLTQPVKPLKA